MVLPNTIPLDYLFGNMLINFLPLLFCGCFVLNLSLAKNDNILTYVAELATCLYQNLLYILHVAIHVAIP